MTRFKGHKLPEREPDHKVSKKTCKLSPNQYTTRPEVHSSVNARKTGRRLWLYLV